LAADDGETVGAGIDVAIPRAPQVDETPENCRKMSPDPMSQQRLLVMLPRKQTVQLPLHGMAWDTI
jgi:hypothetical protein